MTYYYWRCFMKSAPVEDAMRAASTTFTAGWTAALLMVVPSFDLPLVLADGTASWPFAIFEDVFRDAVGAAVQGLYSSRCGYAVRTPAVAHPPCHVADGKFVLRNGQKLPDSRDVSGAWHNGGDYRRSTLSAAQAVIRTLSNGTTANTPGRSFVAC
jgi:hypothetical protein